MAFNLKKVLKALLFSSSQPLSINEIQDTFTRFHEQDPLLGGLPAGEAKPDQGTEPGAVPPVGAPVEPPAELPLEPPVDEELYRDVPALVTRQQAESWAADLDSWDVCDGLCGNLLDKTPMAYELATAWSTAASEFVKRAGFVLMCMRALHDRAAGDETFLGFLALVEREADDERPFVKKAINWALRQIGKRNGYLHAAAVEVGLRLRDSGSKAARWVASDALRELTDERTIARLGR